MLGGPNSRSFSFRGHRTIDFGVLRTSLSFVVVVTSRARFLQLNPTNPTVEALQNQLAFIQVDVLGKDRSRGHSTDG